VSPDWLTSLSRAVGRAGADDSGIPVASAKLDDVQDLLGGALFLPLFKWFREEGPVYRLAAGPRNFVIVSDPAVAKHVLRGYGSRYEKGLVAEVSEFLFGSGFAIAEGALWTVSSLNLSLSCVFEQKKKNSRSRSLLHLYCFVHFLENVMVDHSFTAL
jgi:carotene epsilon-monooxygenase